MPRGLLILEDGTTVEGDYIGPRKDVFAEIVFNTSMTGYQEAFTDPSYAGQILLMTYPLIGNYGLYNKYAESPNVHIRGLVVNEPCFSPSRGINLSRYIKETHLPCLFNVDTRTLTLIIRDHGTMKAMLIPDRNHCASIPSTLARLKARSHPDTTNLVGSVSCRRVTVHKGINTCTLVLVDCGVKNSIVQNLRKYATIIQVPYDTQYSSILRYNPKGVVISNGPGNPENPRICATTLKTIRKLMGRVPLCGICLGHQLLGIALGYRTYKMKFGHRGSNHAVKHLPTNRVYITSQNHGYALRPDNIRNCVIEWVNVNDGTIEGLRHRDLPLCSVQFHPEAAPGPHDTAFLFKQFMEVCNAKA